MPLCIVPCGKKKIWDIKPDQGRTPAREAYIGPFAKTCIQYAEHFYQNSYRILSAKYGFLKPEEEIENYDITCGDPEAIDRDELIQQVIDKDLLNYNPIILICGACYRKKARDAFVKAAQRRGLPEPQIITPLQGKGIGQMLRTLKEAIRNNAPIE